MRIRLTKAKDSHEPPTWVDDVEWVEASPWAGGVQYQQRGSDGIGLIAYDPKTLQFTHETGAYHFCTFFEADRHEN